jgi:hypothetical protein
MRDYLTGKPYYTFCGYNKLNQAALKLLELAKTENLEPVLKYIPEDMAKKMTPHKSLKLAEDRDNFDYVFSLNDALAADDKKSRRKYLRQFKNRYSPSFRHMDLSNISDVDIIIKNARDWTLKKDGNPDQLENEIPAMRRLVTDLPEMLLVLGLFHGDKLIGFSIDSIVDEEYAIGHFQRTDYDYGRVSLYLNHKVNSYLLEKKIKFINVQCDAGDLKLRTKKLEKMPYAFFLKKYKIELAG